MRKLPKSGLNYRRQQFTILNMTYLNAVIVSSDIKKTVSQ